MTATDGEPVAAPPQHTGGSHRSAIDLTRISALHVAVLALLSAVSPLVPHLSASSLWLGGMLMAANVWLLKLATQVLMTGAGEGSSGRVGLAVGAFVLHFGLFLGLAAALLWRLPIEPMSFAAGVTSLLVACVIEAVCFGKR